MSSYHIEKKLDVILNEWSVRKNARPAKFALSLSKMSFNNLQINFRQKTQTLLNNFALKHFEK